jgi:hypothetical protein
MRLSKSGLGIALGLSLLGFSQSARSQIDMITQGATLNAVGVMANSSSDDSWVRANPRMSVPVRNDYYVRPSCCQCYSTEHVSVANDNFNKNRSNMALGALFGLLVAAGYFGFIDKGCSLEEEMKKYEGKFYG